MLLQSIIHINQLKNTCFLHKLHKIRHLIIICTPANHICRPAKNIYRAAKHIYIAAKHICRPAKHIYITAKQIRSVAKHICRAAKDIYRAAKQIRSVAKHICKAAKLIYTAPNFKTCRSPPTANPKIPTGLRSLTSTCVRRLFWFGSGKAGIQKMRSRFFERSKSSGGAGTQPAGCGGKNSNSKIKY